MFRAGEKLKMSVLAKSKKSTVTRFSHPGGIRGLIQLFDWLRLSCLIGYSFLKPFLVYPFGVPQKTQHKKTVSSYSRGHLMSVHMLSNFPMVSLLTGVGVLKISNTVCFMLKVESQFYGLGFVYLAVYLYECVVISHKMYN